MKEPILKAVAMPPRIFWAPAKPALMNLGVQLPMTFMMNAFGNFNPIFLVGSILIVHLGIIAIGVKEPHLSKMMESQGKLPIFYKRIYSGNGRKKLAQ